MSTSTLISERPGPGAPRPFRFPTFTRTTLDNGFTLITCNVPGRPLGSAYLVFEAGAVQEPAANAGAATLAARLLTEGTENFDATGFAETVERLGAELHSMAGWEQIYVTATAPMSRMEAVLDLVVEAGRRATFPEREFERLRSERLNQIKQAFANPLQRAVMEFMATVYRADSAYARPQGGTTETVGALTRDAVVEHYGTFATPASATLIVAGDLDGFPVEKITERLFGDWRAPEPNRTRPNTEEAFSGSKVTIVDRPGSVQSNMVLGHLGIPRSAPDYDAVDLMSYILGGSFNSRINAKLREEKGYTYGARGFFDARRDAGPFMTFAPVETSVTAPAAIDAVGEIRNLIDGGVTQEELDAARDYQTGIFALRFETPEAIANGIHEILLFGLDDDYFDTYGPTLESLTTDDVSRAARDHLRPDGTALIVCGDAEKIEASLKDANLGPVTVVEDPPLG